MVPDAARWLWSAIRQPTWSAQSSSLPHPIPMRFAADSFPHSTMQVSSSRAKVRGGCLRAIPLKLAPRNLMGFTESSLRAAAGLLPREPPMAFLADDELRAKQSQRETRVVTT